MKIKITKKIVVNTIIALIIIAIGLFAMNQYIIYSNNVQLLLHPCVLCQNAGNRCYAGPPMGFEKPLTPEQIANLSNIMIINSSVDGYPWKG